MKPVAILCVSALAALLAWPAAPAQSAPAPATSRSALYDTKADGSQQIAEAIKKATADNKRIILKFGANW